MLSYPSTLLNKFNSFFKKHVCQCLCCCWSSASQRGCGYFLQSRQTAVLVSRLTATLFLNCFDNRLMVSVMFQAKICILRLWLVQSRVCCFPLLYILVNRVSLGSGLLFRPKEEEKERKRRTTLLSPLGKFSFSTPLLFFLSFTHTHAQNTHTYMHTYRRAITNMLVNSFKLLKPHWAHLLPFFFLPGIFCELFPSLLTPEKDLQTTTSKT